MGDTREEYLSQRHEDFQPADIALEIGKHVHQMTSIDVVTRLNAVESCR
jgi:hypothetical protein